MHSDPRNLSNISNMNLEESMRVYEDLVEQNLHLKQQI